MELIRTIVKSTKEPIFKEVAWLDTRNNRFQLKFYRNGEWINIYAPDMDFKYLSKEEAAKLYALKIDIPDTSSFITNTVDNLVNYYKKTETYNKEEVDRKIVELAAVKLKAVDSLPVVGESNIIYLVPARTSSESNYKEEYIWVDDRWELIGTTKVDLSDYVSKAELYAIADNEDLTFNDGKLHLADKSYSPEQFSGLGRVYLRKNIVDGNNILTQEMINLPNTIYIIQYDYNLNGATINIPENCTLKFEGGSLSNGVLNGGNSIIFSGKTKIFNRIRLNGNFENKWYVEWWGANANREDCQVPINEAIEEINRLTNGGALILTDTYNTTDTVYVMPKVSIIGESRNNFYSTASPNGQTKTAIAAAFSEPNKWIIDIKYPDGMAFKYNDFLLDWTGSWGGTRSCGTIISNFDIFGTGDTIPFGAIRLSNLFNCHIKNIGIYGTFYGLHVTSSWNNTFDNLFINTYYNAIYLGKNATVNTFINGYLISIKDKNINYEKPFVYDTSYPPYIDVERPAIILEGSQTDKTAGIFLGYIFQDYTALLIGTRYISYLPSPYLENKKLFDTLIWNFDGYSEITGGYFGGFYNCKITSYEYGTVNGKIVSDGIPTARCYNNLKDERIDKKTLDNNTSYLIKNVSFGKIAYYDTIITGADEVSITGFERTKTKQLEIDYSNVKFHIDDRSKKLQHPLIYIGGLFFPNQFGTTCSFDELLSLDNLPNKLNIQIRYYNSWKTDKIIENKEVFILSSKVSDGAKNAKFDAPIKLKNSKLAFKDKTYSWTWAAVPPECAFEVYGNVEITDFGYHETAQFNSSKFIKLCGDSDVNVVIHTSKGGVLDSLRIENLILNTDFKHRYKIIFKYPDGTNKEISNLPKTSGTFAQKPLGSTGIPIGFQYFCTDKQTTEGASNGIMIYYKGNNVWVDALGRVVGGLIPPEPPEPPVVSTNFSISYDFRNVIVPIGSINISIKDRTFSIPTKLGERRFDTGIPNSQMTTGTKITLNSISENVKKVINLNTSSLDIRINEPYPRIPLTSIPITYNLESNAPTNADMSITLISK